MRMQISIEKCVYYINNIKWKIKMITQGKIVTFYSYKGGAGRTMLLANIAWIIASNGKKVLTIDWDLDAPGLHKYFSPFMKDKSLKNTQGVIDLFRKYQYEFDNKSITNNLLNAFTLRLNCELPSNGIIDFIPAGRQTKEYSNSVNTFNWSLFYEKYNGSAFLDNLKDDMRYKYDYILIDSRTGISDISGICTIEMPDIVLICFTGNNQSIEGGARIAASVLKEWASENIANNTRSILPLFSRTDDAEKQKLKMAKKYAINHFNTFLADTIDKEKYWGEVFIPYISWYAYEECLSVFEDKSLDERTLLKAIEKLMPYLTQNKIYKLIPPEINYCEKIQERYPRRYKATMEDYDIPHKYVLRDADNSVFKEIEKNKVMICIIGGKGMGKSEMINSQSFVQQQRGKLKSVTVSFKNIPIKTLESCSSIWKNLILQIQRAQFTTHVNDSVTSWTWNEKEPYNLNVHSFFSQTALVSKNSPLLICIDDIEVILHRPVKSDFFSSIRGIFDERDDPVYENISWILASTLEPKFFIDKLNRTPFNVACSIILKPFSKKQIQELSNAFTLELEDEDIDKIIDDLGGIPILVNRLLKKLSEKADRLTNKDYSIENIDIIKAHLNKLFLEIKNDSEMKKKLISIINNQTIKEDIHTEHLKGLGMIEENNKQFKISCNLYKKFFSQQFIK